MQDVRARSAGVRQCERPHDALARVPDADGQDGRPATLLRAAEPLDASRDAPVGRGVHDQISLRAAGIAAEHDVSYVT